jgi:hypothetical protein
MRIGRGAIKSFLLFILGIAHSRLTAQVVPIPQGETAHEDSNDAEMSHAHVSVRDPISLTVVTVYDAGGHDRYGVVIFRRSDWLLENINWVDRSGTDAVSLLLAGKRLRWGSRVEISLLAGPWYEYANHAWDEAVIDTNIQFRREHFRFVSVNHWGVPTRATAEFFASHIVTIRAMPGLPTWLGATGQIEHSRTGIEALWAGPVFTKTWAAISLNGAPYWDFHHQRGGIRLNFSYELPLRTKRPLSETNAQE